MFPEMKDFETFTDDSANKEISPVKSKVLEDCSSGSSFNTMSKKEIKETKSEYIKRPFMDRSKKQRTSEITKNVVDLINQNKQNLANVQARKNSIRIQKKFCLNSSDESSECNKKMKCLEHHKELDMVCEHPDCLMSICSSCILFGKHKNHQYTQIENFFENVETMKENLKGVQMEVKKNKKSIILSHDSQNLISRVKQNRKKIESSITNYCDKVIERIRKKKSEMLSEVKYYFKGIKSKLGKYCEESLDYINSNDKWNNQLNHLFMDHESSPKEVQNCFKFLGKIKEKKLFYHGQKILDNFNEMQKLLNNKIKECLDSFSITFSDFGENLFKVTKKEIIFTNDIRKKLKLFSTSHSNNLENKSLQNVDIHEMKMGSGPLDEDCFLDSNMDQLSSNLMSSLNLLNDKVMKNGFDFSNKDNNSQKMGRASHNASNRFPLKEIPKNCNFMKSQSEISEHYREQPFKKQSILSSVNIDTDMGIKIQRKKKSNSNKNFKILPRNKPTQGETK
jgi:hypothetical protein